MNKLLTLSFFTAITILAIAAEEALTVKGLLLHADANDGKAAFLTGKISEFEQKTSKKGNLYFVFKVKEDDKTINGFSHGEQKPPLKVGDKVEVRGIFRKSKQVGELTFKNEIDVSAVKEKPYGVKKVN